MKNEINKQVNPLPVNTDELKILIVDDERIACKNLIQLFMQYFGKEINIIGVANNTGDAEKLIEAYKPDAVFLDIEMPKENAFRFLERIHPFYFEVVFITGHDNYAVRAFKMNAVDYLLKPVSIPDLQNAVEKVRGRMLYKYTLQSNPQLYSKLAKDISAKAQIHQLVLKEKDYSEIVNVKDILFVEAQGSYADVHFLKEGMEKNILMSYSVAEYEELLPVSLFYRIHRSYLVNCQYIKGIVKEETPFIILQDKYRLPIGRRRYAELLSFLKANAFLH